MRKADFATNHIEFISWIRTYGDLLYRLLEAKRVVRTKFEKLEILEAFVLRFAARWEVLFVQDIITSLNRDPSIYAKALSLHLRKHLSVDECKAILYGHRYLDFRGVDDIKSFAKKYLCSSQNPFQAISSTDAKRIDEFLIMRNLLAHYSDLAWRSYDTFMRNRYSYIRVPEPGEFLMGSTRTGEYRWSEYFRAFGKASDDMMRHVTKKTPNKSLQPTRHTPPGS
jgi:hypothetical protein